MRRRIDARRGHPLQELDPILGIVRGLLQIDLVEALSALQIAFGERWPLIGPVRLLRHQSDAPLSIHPANALAGALPRHTAPNDDIRELVHNQTSPSIMPWKETRLVRRAQRSVYDEATMRGSTIKY